MDVPTGNSPDRLAPTELAAWQGFLRTHARFGRLLNADLERQHGLSESRYDVLIQLGLAKGRRLRMTTLAGEVLMSPSGLSRLVDELERDGLVVRERRGDDGRAFDVVLTPAGRTRLRAANRTHLAGVRALFLDPLSHAQLGQLSEIWAALASSVSVEPPGQSGPLTQAPARGRGASRPTREA